VKFRESTVDLKILEEDCEWQAEEVADESSWTEVFDREEQEELDAALRHALTVSLRLSERTFLSLGWLHGCSGLRTN
jgi:hypothetical protein